MHSIIQHRILSSDVWRSLGQYYVYKKQENTKIVLLLNLSNITKDQRTKQFQIFKEANVHLLKWMHWNIAILFIYFFVKAVLSYQCIDAVHHGILMD